MKIIDDKGRLFGKINIFDFLVILFLLCILPAFYFGYKIMTKKPVSVVETPSPQPEPEMSLDMEIKCQFVRLRPKTVKMISVGDKELNEKGQVIAEIVKIGEIAPYTYKFDIGSGEKAAQQDSFLKQVPVVLKIATGLKDGGLFYKGERILRNSTFHFKTDKYQVEGLFVFHKLKPKPRGGVLPGDKITPLGHKVYVLENQVASLTPLGSKINTLESRINKLNKKLNYVLSLPRIKKQVKKIKAKEARERSLFDE